MTSRVWESLTCPVSLDPGLPDGSGPNRTVLPPSTSQGCSAWRAGLLYGGF